MIVVDRGVTNVLGSRLERHKVVVLEGARAVGKTTVARALADVYDGSYLDLADRTVLQAMEADAPALLGSGKAPVVVDEAQLIEDLPLSVKRIVDSRNTNGQFLLTGSSRISRGALGGSDPLAGRATRVSMFPLTVGERMGRPINVVEVWMAGDITTHSGPELAADDLISYVVQGGLPGSVLNRPGVVSNDDWWMLATETMPTYLESALSLLYGKYDADRQRLVRTIRYLSANPAQILNVSRLANELELSRDTARRYIEMLSDALLIHQLPSVRSTAHKTIAAHPKLAVFDTAFASWAAGVAPSELLLNGLVWGGLVENLVALELLAQASWSRPGTTVGHWRQSSSEVDCVITDAGGRTVGVEIKAASSVSNRDTAGLRALAKRLDDRFVLGVVLYRGAVTFELDERIWAAPISALWA